MAQLESQLYKIQCLCKSSSLTYWSTHGLFAELLPVPAVWSLRIARRLIVKIYKSDTVAQQ